MLVGGWEQLVEQEHNKQLPLATSEQISNAPADAKIPVAVCSCQEGKKKRKTPATPQASTDSPASAFSSAAWTMDARRRIRPVLTTQRERELSSSAQRTPPLPVPARPHGRRTRSPSCGRQAIAAGPSQVGSSQAASPGPRSVTEPRAAPRAGTPPPVRARHGSAPWSTPIYRSH